MKKLLLTSLLSVSFVLTYAQFNFATNTVIGQQLVTVGTQSTFTVNFDNLTTTNGGTIVRDCASWTGTVVPYTLNFQKCQTQKGLQVMSYADATTTTDTRSNDFKCYRYGTNDNPCRIYSMDSLISVMRKSAANGTATNGPSYPAACLFGTNPANAAFGQYPGKFKRVEYGFQFNFESKAVLSDLVFEIDTYDAGTTGKSASYELAVYKGTTISDANLIAPKIADFYVTGSGKKTVHLAQDLGISVNMLSNKKICIFLRTLGTTNSEGVADAVPHDVDSNSEPLKVDPTIVFDNFSVTYGTASWTYPAGVVANAVINHNNGSPEFVGISATDYSGGTPVKIYGGSDQPVKIYLSSSDRIGSFTILEANDGGGHAAGFSFAETGAIKKNDGSGNYSIDVAYTRAIDAITGKYSITVPAPVSGSVTEDLEITLLGNVNVGATRAIRLEFNNGIRFWYNVSITADTWTANNVIDLDKPQIWSAQNSIFVANTKNDVQIFNLAGQKVKVATAQEAEKGIAVKSGIYIIKTAATVQKLIVE